MKYLLFILLLITASSAQAHRGNIDKHGGHYNKYTHQYECHEWFGSCSSSPRISSKQENKAYEDAIDEAERKKMEWFNLTTKQKSMRWSSQDLRCMGIVVARFDTSTWDTEKRELRAEYAIYRRALLKLFPAANLNSMVRMYAEKHRADPSYKYDNQCNRSLKRLTLIKTME